MLPNFAGHSGTISQQINKLDWTTDSHDRIVSMSLVTLTPPTLLRIVSSGWGAPRTHRNGNHEGLDFPGDVGSPIFASADGIVVQVDNVDNSFAGKFIAIQHDGGVVSRYLHNEKNLVTIRQRVTRGEVIATLGQTGTSGTGAPHLHFDVKLQAEAFQEYLRRFGTPSPGYSTPRALGVGVPAEALMSGVSYRPETKRSSLNRGVKFHSSAPAVVGLLVAGVGIGAGLRYLTNR